MKYLISLIIAYWTINSLQAQSQFSNKELNITVGLVNNFTGHTFFNIDQSLWKTQNINLNYSAGLEYLLKLGSRFKMGPSVEIQNFKHKMRLHNDPSSVYRQDATQIRGGLTMLYNIKNKFELYTNLSWLNLQNHGNKTADITRSGNISYISKNQNNRNVNALSINVGLRKTLHRGDKYYGNVSALLGLSTHGYEDFVFEYFENDKSFQTYNCFDALRLSLQYSYNILPKKSQFKLKKHKPSKQKSRFDCPSF